MNEFVEPIDWLREEFQSRKLRNPSYSLRSFSMRVGVSAARLSQYLSGKKPITKRAVKKISRQLDYSIEKENYILELLDASKRNEKKDDLDVTKLTIDTFKVISDWQYFAFLSLMKLRTFRFDLRWISQELGVSKLETREVIERLTRLGLIKEKGGVLKRTKEKLVTTNEVEDRALKKSHKQLLDQAKNCLDQISLEMREISSITMAIDTRKIPAAKKQIRKFKKEMEKLLESRNADKVYNLNIQLVPGTRLQGGQDD